MTLRKYIMLIGLVCFMGWGSFILVMVKLEPCTAAGIITLCHSIATVPLILAFVSGFFAFAGTFTVLGVLMRYWLNQQEMYLDYINVSIRQAILLTIAALGAAALLLIESLTWWSGFLLIAVIFFAELYFTRD